jgi:hypothetical protein
MKADGKFIQSLTSFIIVEKNSTVEIYKLQIYKNERKEIEEPTITWVLYRELLRLQVIQNHMSRFTVCKRKNKILPKRIMNTHKYP